MTGNTSAAGLHCHYLISYTVPQQASPLCLPVLGKVVNDCNGSGALQNVTIFHLYICVRSVIMRGNVVSLSVSAKRDTCGYINTGRHAMSLTEQALCSVG